MEGASNRDEDNVWTSDELTTERTPLLGDQRSSTSSAAIKDDIEPHATDTDPNTINLEPSVAEAEPHSVDAEPSIVDVVPKRKIALIMGSLVLANVILWVATAIAFRNYASLFGTAALSAMLGLRHAVDADHLAAIDNVTRKLLQSGQRSVSVGLFFSLGHSTIVIIASAAIAITATTIKDKFGQIGAVGGLIGTSVSAAFLFVIGIMNVFVLISVHRSLRRLKRTGTFREENINDILNRGGLLGRFFGPVYRFIDASWKMYPLGVLFGFGFDTSTEVGLLAIAAVQANRGLPIGLIMIFPLLFTAAMAFVDTLDGIFMLGTYTWAYLNPVRKLYYNFVITLLSVVVAFMIGTVELLNIISEQLELSGPFWNFFSAIGEHFGTIGFVIIGLFAVTWAGAILVYRWSGYYQLERKIVQEPPPSFDAGEGSSMCDIEASKSDVKLESDRRSSNVSDDRDDKDDEDPITVLVYASKGGGVSDENASCKDN